MVTTPGHEIMIGYDGSAGSVDALDWAVREAWLRELPLTICHAWTPAYPALTAGAAGTAVPVPANGGVDPAYEQAEAVLAQALRHAQAADARVTLRPLLVRGPAARALCEQCGGADMLVVGSRGVGGFAGLLLGSVSLQVAAHAPVPVTVVRGRWRPVPGHHPRPVVVGTDGSPGSQAALDFAVDEAVLRGVPLVAVCALSDAPGVFGTARAIEGDFSTRIAKVQADHPDLLITKRAEEGAPRSALLAAAAHGQLLVVGARGRGGLRDMRLGSVSLAVLHHATCPVTVVHGA